MTCDVGVHLIWNHDPELQHRCGDATYHLRQFDQAVWTRWLDRGSVMQQQEDGSAQPLHQDAPNAVFSPVVINPPNIQFASGGPMKIGKSVCVSCTILCV